MWPGQQPPGGEQNPQNQNPQNPNPYQQPGYQQPNPYQQPAYQQPNPYQQQAPWGAPTPMGAPQPPNGQGGGNRTKFIAIGAATAVVVAAGVTGALVLGGGKDDNAGGDKPSAPASSARSAPASAATGDDSRSAQGDKPTVPGWKVVVNPKWGTAFDVPPEWAVQSPDTIMGFDDTKKKSGNSAIVMSAPAVLKEKWCTSDEDKDGRLDNTALAVTGTKGAGGAKDTDQTALVTVPWWVYGGYTQPDTKSITVDKKAKPYTTAAGVKGSVAWARSRNTPQKGKCDSDGKAITFGFRNSTGDFVSWSFYGATGVKDEVPDATILKILSTVRLHGTPTKQ
ncbi:hypothetical protein AB0C59_25980 [Streptomyces sp. NPDC048664]|uniref:hypothetical protein n=1 Tax=Streptomyces sp. NPDC048664 TaxID=3154505 RepID=UPI003414EDF9